MALVLKFLAFDHFMTIALYIQALENDAFITSHIKMEKMLLYLLLKKLCYYIIERLYLMNLMKYYKKIYKINKIGALEL